MKCYKFFRPGLLSSYDNSQWEIGKWRKITGKVRLCGNGFHASTQPLDALKLARGEILAIVEGRGEQDIDDDKIAFAEMRIIKAYKWTQKDNVVLAVYCAELVLPIFEKQYPNDDRPRKAINVAKKWLKNPTAVGVADACAAADAAYAACVDAAADAVIAADAAAYAVIARAADAAYAADAAARAVIARAADAKAADAACAACAKVKKKINAWMKRRINKLERIYK